jgi:hypothetical protein
MDMRLSILALLALTLATVPRVSGADSQSAWSSECARRIASPVYPQEAIGNRLAGVVFATFTVDSKGTASQLSTEGPTILADAVDLAIRKTNFSQACGGRSIATKFSFTISDDLPLQPSISACFQGNLGFHVTAGPIRMVCSHFVNVVPLTANNGLKAVTVCDLLANPTSYAGRDLAILGRLDQTFDGSWLSEDNCETRIKTGGYIWPSTVWIAAYNQAPDPPLGLLVLDENALSEKLASVRHTTALQMKEVGTYNPADKTFQNRVVQQTWAVIYGRVEVQPTLRPPSSNALNRDWGNGFGHMNAAPIQVIYKQENSVYIRDDDPRAVGTISRSGSEKGNP